MEIFQYEFMRRAFLVGVLLAIAIPCIGMSVVLKRLSMIGDALSHASLAGVAAGLLLGVSPVVGAVATAIVAALGIEGIRRKLPKYAEMAVAIVMAAGVGLAGVLSGFIGGGANFNSFLFGSIVAITDFELLLVGVVGLAVILTAVLLYKELFYVCLDERSARLVGVPVKTVNFVLTILTALTVSVAAKTVGALMVSSMMVVPVACGMQLGKSYKGVMLWSVGLDVVFTVIGLFLAFYCGLGPGGTIVLVGVASLLLLILVQQVWAKARRGGQR